AQSAHPICGLLADPPELLEHLERRAGKRALPFHRRWRELEADVALSGSADRSARQARRYGVARPLGTGLGAGGDGGGKDRLLPIGALRRELGADFVASRSDARALLLHARLRRSLSCRDGLCCQSAALEINRRRRELHGNPDAARRQPRPLDRSRRSQPSDRGARRRRLREQQRRPDLVVDLQPAHSAILSHRHRQPVSYRVYATQQDNTTISTPSAAAWGAITLGDCTYPGTGESVFVAVHPEDPNIVYCGAIGSSPGGAGALQR